MNTEQIGDYIVQIDKLLGIGQQSKVFLCYKSNNPQEEYCIKIFHKDHYNKLDSYIEVIKKLMHHNCENLVKVIDIVETPRNYCIVMEVCNYDLEYECKLLTKKNQWFSRNEQVGIIKSILKGAKVLFENKIIHKDNQSIKDYPMKEKSIKFLSSFIYKLDGLQFAQISDDIYKQNQFNDELYSNFVYIAPEILLHSVYSAKCDIYSYGVIFHYIIFNRIFPGNPKYSHDVIQFIEMIKEKPFKCNKLDDDIGNKLTDLIDSMLLYDQNDRISFENLFLILQDPLINQEDNIQNQDDNLKSKYNQLYLLIDIFYRKSILCQSVMRYLKSVLVETNTDFFIIQLLIGIIGFEEIRFALAILHTKESDIQSYVKKLYDISLLKNYLEYSKSSLKDNNLHKKIYQQSYKQQRELYDDYSDFIQHINQKNDINQFKDMIELFKEQQQQQCNIKNAVKFWMNFQINNKQNSQFLNLISKNQMLIKQEDLIKHLEDKIYRDQFLN